jgi:DNA polymerase III epsilon subunit-like protein
MSELMFIDTETTGLHPEIHGVWEIGLITEAGQEHLIHLRDVNLKYADGTALKITRFYERYEQEAKAKSMTAGQFVEWFLEMAEGKHWVGAIPSFDEERIRRVVYAQGLAPTWHYHLIDVEAMAVGYLSTEYNLDLPWDSEHLSKLLGIHPDTASRHTALGDARWAKAMYEAVMRLPPHETVMQLP